MSHSQTRWQVAAERARSHDGLLLLSDCHAVGIPTRTAYDAVARRGWQLVYPGVFAMPGTTLTPWLRARAAIASLPQPAAAAGWTAVAAYGLTRRTPSTPEILTDPRTARHQRDGCTVRGSGDFAAMEAATIDGLSCLSPPWALVDIARHTDRAFLRGLLIDARQQGLCELEEVEATLTTRARPPGKAVLEQLLWELHPERCDSVLEAWTRRVVAASDLTAPAPQPVPVPLGDRTLHLDLGWPEVKVGVECDGLGSHSSRAHLETDQRRHNALVIGGWRVLRVSWWRLERDPEGFLRDLRQLLASAGAA